MRTLIALLVVMLTLAVTATQASARHDAVDTATWHVHLHISTPRALAWHLARLRHWTGYQWQALDTIIHRESGWNPCRHYPSTTDCNYSGGNACGIPQANPCPAGWRGRLGRTWRAQVRWLMAYIVSHGYGTPANALAYWNRNGSY